MLQWFGLRLWSAKGIKYNMKSARNSTRNPHVCNLPINAPSDMNHGSRRAISIICSPANATTSISACWWIKMRRTALTNRETVAAKRMIPATPKHHCAQRGTVVGHDWVTLWACRMWSLRPSFNMTNAPPGVPKGTIGTGSKWTLFFGGGCAIPLRSIRRNVVSTPILLNV